MSGHSNFQTVVDNYLRVSAEEKQEAMEKVTNVLFTKNAI